MDTSSADHVPNADMCLTHLVDSFSILASHSNHFIVEHSRCDGGESDHRVAHAKLAKKNESKDLDAYGGVMSLLVNVTIPHYPPCVITVFIAPPTIACNNRVTCSTSPDLENFLAINSVIPRCSSAANNTGAVAKPCDEAIP